jgi:hypothetical protein
MEHPAIFGPFLVEEMTSSLKLWDSQNSNIVDYFSGTYRGVDKSLARPTSLSIVFLVQETGGR